MARCTWLLWACLLIAVGVARAEGLAPPAQINLVSEEWLEYTGADGTGLGWDLMRKVFEPAGVKVRLRVAPYTRAVGLVRRGEVDAWVGSYKDESPALYPRWHFDVDRIFALGLAGRPPATLAEIGRYRLAWVRGYEFDKYLPGIQYYNEVQRRTGILAMLGHGRTDFYIDSLAEVEFVLKDAEDPAQYSARHLIDLPLYLGFADTARGRALMQLFDQRMSELVPSGELRPIFERWHQPYPYDDSKWADHQPH
jgi:polar amino acid transport system substrate-binding protein